MQIKNFLKSEKNKELLDEAGQGEDYEESPKNDVLQSEGDFEDESICGLSDLYCPEELAESHVQNITDILLDSGKITQEEYSSIQPKLANISAEDLDKSLVKDYQLSCEDILIAKAKLYDLEFRYLEPEKIERTAFEKLDIDFIKNNSVCPIAIEEGVLIVATSEPENIFAIEDVKRLSQMDVETVVCPNDDIVKVCDIFEDKEEVEYSINEIINDMTDIQVVQNEERDFEDLEKMAGQSPVIKFVNYLISNAIKEGASDIHIEPKNKATKIRCRIDGVLFETMQAPLQMHPAVVSRIKIMSNLDISERRLPQDGKISVIVGGRGVDLRVSVLPTSHGEKVVIRVLDSKSILLGLDELGMEPKVKEEFKTQIALPHGILLVTGPTGSGKSTTLYSALSQMDGTTMNVSTVEDPVEYELEFCNQVQANDKIGLTFASALRSLLRQDPDIIMIGEIRDNETARIAVQAALTGHLVLSTLHTNDAASSITRLVNIGIDSYLIAASLNAVLAQRLVRKICAKCKEIYQVPQKMRKYLEKSGIDPEQVFAGKGCDYCRGSGYVGRIGIYELLVVDDNFRDRINKDSSVNNMRRSFIKSGQASLFEDGLEKVRQGLTTIEEIIRVTEIYGQNEEEIFIENIR